MTDIIDIGFLSHLNGKVTVELEEGKNFRRITFRRFSMVFGEYREQGRVSIFMDEVDKFRELLDSAEWCGIRVSEAGLETARREVLDG